LEHFIPDISMVGGHIHGKRACHNTLVPFAQVGFEMGYILIVPANDDAFNVMLRKEFFAKNHCCSHITVDGLS
jgi:hypothetical protein